MCVCVCVLHGTAHCGGTAAWSGAHDLASSYGLIGKPAIVTHN